MVCDGACADDADDDLTLFARVDDGSFLCIDRVSCSPDGSISVNESLVSPRLYKLEMASNIWFQLWAAAPFVTDAV